MFQALNACCVSVLPALSRYWWRGVRGGRAVCAAAASRGPGPRQSAPHAQRDRADDRAPTTHPPAPTAISPSAARSCTTLHHRTVWLHSEFQAQYSLVLLRLGALK